MPKRIEKDSSGFARWSEQITRSGPQAATRTAERGKRRVGMGLKKVGGLADDVTKNAEENYKPYMVLN